MSKWKIGQELYHVVVYDDGSCECQTWVIRSIQRRRIKSLLRHHSTLEEEPTVKAVEKCVGVTWVKQSKKHFDYGWASSIPSYMSEEWKLSKEPRKMFSTTKLAAWKAALTDKSNFEYLGDDEDGSHEALKEKAIRTIKSNITKNSKKKAAK